MSDSLDEAGLELLARAIVERLDLHTRLLEDVHAACCEEAEGPSPLMEMLKQELGEVRASIDRQTRALDRLTAALQSRPSANL